MALGRQRKLLAAGATAPDFRLKRLEGGESSRSDIAADGPALLAFFKISCPVCQLTFPFLERLHAPGRLSVYGISQNDARDTADFKRRFGITFPLLLDPEDRRYPVSNEFGISTVPTLFLVESDGTIARVIEGWSKEDIESLAARSGSEVFRPGDENVPQWKPG